MFLEHFSIGHADKREIFQNFLNADEISHLKKKAAILNLSNEVIVNKNFLHKEGALYRNGSTKPGE